MKKPFPRRSLSPKGGRPQAPERDGNSSKQREKVNEKTAKAKDLVIGKSKDANTKKEKTSSDKKRNDEVKGEENARKKKVEAHGKAVKVNSPNVMLQNPLEILEQEITMEEETEKITRREKPGTAYASVDVRSELDPIETATAELFPHPISEEQALATLDSLQSDFASLDQAEALPKDYNGIPLTSLKQQQIIHMLTKLSKALNMEDTLTSTVGATRSEPVRDVRGQGSKSEIWTDSRCVPSGASNRNGSNQGISSGEMCADVSGNSGNESANSSSIQNLSASSANSRARMSPTGSILSSASSVSASRSRMSPKSLKNTVHFSTLVTEISTSASQSYEDKISYRKLDITPKNSENFEEGDIGDMAHAAGTEQTTESVEMSVGATSSGLNLLGKVALTPSVDTSSGSPGEFHSNHPFEDSAPDGELNTSDKENEYVPPPVEENSDDTRQSSRSTRPVRNPYIWNVYMANMPEGPVGENHPALGVEKSALKCDLPETALKVNTEKVILQENLTRTNMPMDTQYYYINDSSSLERLVQGKITPDASISSLQEEITRSYLLSQYKTDIKGDYRMGVKNPEKAMDISETSGFNIDESAIHLEPIVLTGSQNTLKENRSMLEEEEIIRSNLQRVQFDDSDDESIDDKPSCDKLNLTFEIVEDTHNSDVNLEIDHIVNDQLDIVSEVNDIADSANDNPHKENGENTVGAANEKVDENKHVENISENLDDSDFETEEEIEVDDMEDLNESEDKTGKQNDSQQEIAEIQNEMQKLIDAESIGIDEKETNVDENQHSLETSESEIKVTEVEGPKVCVENVETEIKVTEVQDQDRGGEDEQENKAKAEHIQKYLNQVHEHSLQHEEDFYDEDTDVRKSGSQASVNMMEDIGGLIQSFTSTIQSMNHLSQEELFRLQTEQFEMIQKKLIEHQQAQLEELFVAQRREQMNLQKEIEVCKYYCQLILIHQKF